MDRCPACAGIWCDNDELAKIVASREKTFSADSQIEIVGSETSARVSKEAELSSTLRCVICANTMQRLNYSYTSGIIIDRCSAGHGVWFDKAEIEKVQVFAESWMAQSDRLQSNYGALLKQVGSAAGKSYDQADEEAKLKGRQSSMFGRFIGRMM